MVTLGCPPLTHVGRQTPRWVSSIVVVVALIAASGCGSSGEAFTSASNDVHPPPDEVDAQRPAIASDEDAAPTALTAADAALLLTASSATYTTDAAAPTSALASRDPSRSAGTATDAGPPQRAQTAAALPLHDAATPDHDLDAAAATAGEGRDASLPPASATDSSTDNQAGSELDAASRGTIATLDATTTRDVAIEAAAPVPPRARRRNRRRRPWRRPPAPPR